MSGEALHCRCNHCDQHLSAPQEAAGQVVECPRCGLDTMLYAAPPAPPPEPPAPPPEPANVVFRCACPECGSSMMYPSEMAGLVRRCPGCQGEVRLPLNPVVGGVVPQAGRVARHPVVGGLGVICLVGGMLGVLFGGLFLGGAVMVAAAGIVVAGAVLVLASMVRERGGRAGRQHPETTRRVDH